MNKIIPAVLMLAVLGAGCPSSPMTYKGTNGTKPPAAKLGFGKLPSMQAYGALGTAEAMSSSYMARGSAVLSPMPAAAPVAPSTITLDATVAGDVTVTSNNMVGGGTPGTMAMRIAPMPTEEYKPTPAKYEVTASLPDWNGEGDVLHVKRPQPDASLIRSVASGAGLPGQLINGIQTVQSVQASWRDAQNFVWNIDPVNGNLNWWKEIDWRVTTPPVRPEKPPQVDKARLIAAADAFLDAHGLSAIKAQGGEVENSQWVNILFDKAAASSMPCIMKEEAAVRDISAAGDAKLVVDPMIYPSPCDNYWPQQVSVFYGGSREGLQVVDAGGWPNRATSISVDVTTYEVMGGNVLFTEQTERSAYPLISKDEAMKRLQAGGRNVMYSWDGAQMSVNITEVKLAWMRHDSWANGRQETYFLPALSAKGTSTYNNQEPQEYYTVVPLVADSAFDLDPNGGYPVPMPLMMDAGVATPPPAAIEPAADPVKR